MKQLLFVSSGAFATVSGTPAESYHLGRESDVVFANRVGGPVRAFHRAGADERGLAPGLPGREVRQEGALLLPPQGLDRPDAGAVNRAGCSSGGRHCGMKAQGAANAQNAS